MSVYDPSRALTIPGRLIVGPTQGGLVTGLPLDSTGLPTYGGTVVGYTTKARLEREEEGAFLRSEALSIDAAWCRGFARFALACLLVQYDTTVLNQLWAVTTVSGGGYQGANTLREPSPSGTVTPGVQTPGAQVLFAPDDVTQPGVLLYAPIWTNGQARQDLAYAADTPYEVPVTIVAVGDSSNRVVACDLLENLQL